MSTISFACVATTTVVPLALISFNNVIISHAVSGSRFPVGSSAIIIDGLFTNALASATLCCSPPDNSFGYIFAFPLNPTSESTIGTCLLICRGVALTIYIAYATLS